MKPFLISLFEAQLGAGEWPAAQQTFARIKLQIEEKNRAEVAWSEWAVRLLDAAGQPAENAQSNLLEYMRGRILGVKIFRTTVAVLRKAGRLQTAADALAVAQRAYPGSTWLRVQTEEVAQALAAQAAAVQAAAAQVAATAPAGNVLPSETIFFRQLDAAVAATKWSEVRRLLGKARTAEPAPPWVAVRSADLLLAELRSAHALGEIPALYSSARIYLDGSAERASAVLGFARALQGAGQRDEALRLLNLVLESTPDFPPALRLRSEWRAKR